VLNRDLIIQHLTEVSYIRDTCKIALSFSDDLFQHIWVKILEMDCNKLEQIYSKGYLQFYIYRMIVNEAKNPNNPFLKEMAVNTKRLEEILEPTEDEIEDNFEDNLLMVTKELEVLFWYDKKIFELYVEFGSLRKVAAKTGIKYGSIHQTVCKVKKIVNENINSRGQR
jgi:hypothetical protein